ncbi:30S ribosomal protein S17 [Candidatus Kuenenbacteria bacterium CG_4_9_14_3_um_filter_39_14]|uniref:Small ribosomal subunit protein uS17 n=7 Tax=Candidatus Kueneniibacteriota TaxID=1752740 RepID=A0A2M7IMJ2_9BACT|nr:30S ribosomal protein S17 [Candidatus Kuenenbacteria bacterium]OIP56765.1 MAG: 30S ribosomal protein S17 [Candidatus Kuenenbacteria bacterium CG2_30_39_24]PIP28939.1 MAG: 30S ribosomal protein S17 [Candidatus Kuenenbacteria bacterium CG23_combo_of_CG06-09_8_20_14_all_39_39]PIP75301.1 MAG: 30S ribosomal protein S17 [Candidatus Kuenenbacteria bacterium CG22_combo_CG10-13_8_21_14_all_39_9]PIR81087.1 MAG: 30S ribosomal protein S17 [Candidatus Kuenenbacteria bacterium CG10_big_fil_rev_8_21_14_0_1
MKNNQKKNTDKKKKISRAFTGLVVSDKMDKTIVVRVNRTKIHARYHKRYHVSKNYKVHDPANRFKTGETVKFIECRPMSKEKRWRVVRGLNED